jgi:hypothetical protein
VCGGALRYVGDLLLILLVVAVGFLITLTSLSSKSANRWGGGWLRSFAEDPALSHVVCLLVCMNSREAASSAANGRGDWISKDLSRDQARHFLQGNRLRKQSGRLREDGQMFLGFDRLMASFSTPDER